MSKAERSQGPRETSSGSAGLFISLILQSAWAGPTPLTKHCFSRRRGKGQMLAVLGGQAGSADGPLFIPSFVAAVTLSLPCYLIELSVNSFLIPFLLLKTEEKKEGSARLHEASLHPPSLPGRRPASHSQGRDSLVPTIGKQWMIFLTRSPGE